MGEIKIFTICHKNSFIPSHPLLQPLQVGAIRGAHLDGMFHDDEGENISEKNPMYCELTGHYWVWKHIEAEYYGFYHYRRFLSFAEEELSHNDFQDVVLNRADAATMKLLGYENENLETLIKQYDVITSKPAKLKDLNRGFKCNADQYLAQPYEYKEDLEVLLEIIEEKYPEFLPLAKRYLYEIDYGYFCNMYIMKKNLFMDYSAWLFDILEEHEKRRDYTNYNVDGYRVSGYLGERLFGIYYLYLQEKGCKTLEVQRTLFQDTEPEREYAPVGGEKSVPIVMAANDNYAPYAGTTMLSILEHGSADRFYDFLLLTHDISEKNRAFLQDMAAGFANASLRIVDPSRFFAGYDLFTRAHFSVETYYRLVLPQLLPQYDKVLYLDVDMIAQGDVAALYDTELGNNLLGAVVDVDTAGLYNGFDPGKKTYMDKELGLEDPYHYFQAGTLLLNLKAFRETFTMEHVLEVAASKNWQLLDQDILNVLCENRVKYLDMKWNVLYNYGDLRISKIFRLAPQWMYNAYMEARKAPMIIHYAGPDKPWKYPESDFADKFWNVARKTPYYEALLYRMQGENKRSVTQDKHFEKKSNSAIYRTWRCLRLYGLGQTLREIKRELFH